MIEYASKGQDYIKVAYNSNLKTKYDALYKSALQYSSGQTLTKDEWKVGQQIMIGPTSFNYKTYERKTIGKIEKYEDDVTSGGFWKLFFTKTDENF